MDTNASMLHAESRRRRHFISRRDARISWQQAVPARYASRPTDMVQSIRTTKGGALHQYRRLRQHRQRERPKTGAVRSSAWIRSRRGRRKRRALILALSILVVVLLDRADWC